MAAMTTLSETACSTEPRARTIAVWAPSVMKATVAKTLTKPTSRTPRPKEARTASVSRSAAEVLIEVNSAVASDTAMSEWGSMKMR